LRDQLLEKGLSRERIVFHPNGIDPDLFDPGRYGEDEKRALRRHYGIEQDAVVVTFVSTFGRWHGAGVLATAIRELAEGESEWLRRHRVHFLVVGDGIEMPAVREVLGSAACAPFVTLTGLVRQADAPLHLAVSDLFLSPHVPNPDGTPFFGSPTKLFEYMAMGRGVIASELNQIGDVLAGSPRVSDLARRDSLPGEDECAVLTEPGSPGDLVAAIRFMVENPAWREQSAIHARQRALSLYTWRHHVEHILAALREVLP
ncbi:MAG: glycosyltransferase, partial [Proteobacteria bacterium]|nr:glycosyltransferase [Pseudomonadota bacterium]